MRSELLAEITMMIPALWDMTLYFREPLQEVGHPLFKAEE
jgi:hypothetical protein